MKKISMKSKFIADEMFRFVLSRQQLMLCVMAVVAVFGVGAWGAVGVLQVTQLASALKQSELALLHANAASQIQLEALQNQLHAEQDKQAVYARALGKIQARMARLDALGSRLVDVAALDKSEFDFALEPALGGPRLQQPDTFVAPLHLHDDLNAMNAHLSQLDGQLVAIDYMLEKRHAAENAKPHAWPTEGGWISSPFGQRIDPFNGRPAQHYGVDIANRSGAPVLSTSHGVVTFAGKMVDFGYVVDIEHGYGYRTRYAHMGDVDVHIGDVVTANQLLGHIGSTGRSTGPHLHYEVRRFGQLVNPQAFLPRG